MKIKVEELKKFLSVSSQIKANPLYNTLDSIKIECIGGHIIFSKTNNNIWCKYIYECHPDIECCFLINEKMLNGIMLTTKEQEIEIVKSKKKGVLDIISGEDVIKSNIQELNLFPALHISPGEEIELNQHNISCINAASKFMSKSANRTAMNFVNIDSFGIFATSGLIVYFYKTAFNLPIPAFFDEEPLNIIKSTESVIYWTSENYDFFKAGGFTFGFIKSTVKAIDYLPIVDQTGDVFFSVKKSDLIDFCILVQYSKRNDLAVASFKTFDSVLSLNYSESEYNIDISRNVNIDQNFELDQFDFTVDMMMNALKALPYQVITFTKLASGHYALTTPEDENYKGIISKRIS